MVRHAVGLARIIGRLDESWTVSSIPAEPEEAWSVTGGHQADMPRGTGVASQ